MKNIQHALLLLGLLLSIEVIAQKVQVSEEKLISTDINYSLNEAHLVTDPNNPQHLLVAAILTKKWGTGTFPFTHIVLLQSWDGGKTWQKKHFDEDITFGADPWLAMNKRGTLILTSLNKIKGMRYMYLLVYVSNDSGKTWQKHPLNIGYAHDRQSIVVDPKSQQFIIASAKYNVNNEGKRVGGLMITRLTREGAFQETNWHPLSNVDKNNATPILTPDRTLLVSYVDYTISRRKMVKTRRNWLVKSRDLGRTFSEPILLSEGPNFPYILWDTTQTKKPRLHYLMTKGARREYKGFAMKTSLNGGYTWKKSVDITQFDQAKTYMRQANWIINTQGVIGVFWFDRRDNPNTKAHHLYFTYSKDHGQSFAPPVRVSSKASTPDPKKNGGMDKRWPVGGDYFGLNTTPDGHFRIVWADHRNGKSQLFHALVKVND